MGSPAACPSFLRARVKFIEESVHGQYKDSFDAFGHKLLRYGIIPNEEQHLEAICIVLKNADYKKHQLSFTELTRYNTWFAMHPDKVCGKEVVTNSIEFPITIKGTKEDIIRTISQSASEPISTKKMTIEQLKSKAREIQAKLLMAKTSDWYTDFQGLDGLGAIESLGDLGEVITQNIERNSASIQKILEDDQQYAPTDKLGFDEVAKLYNAGISTDEIKAWVWYQRGKGEKMLGWEKHFLNIKHDTATTVILKSHGEINERVIAIKDNHFRDILLAKGGEMMGRYTGKKLEYGKIQYLIVHTGENASPSLPKNALVYIKERDVDLVQHNINIDQSILTGYVKEGILFYFNGILIPYAIYAFGNMYERELQLRIDKPYILSNYGEEVYDRQYALIMYPPDKGGVRPKMLSVTNPDIQQRPKILAISRFAKEVLVYSLKDETGIELGEETALFDAFKIWLLQLDKKDFKNLTPHQINKYYLDGDSLSKHLSEEEKSVIEKYGMLEGEEFFTRFLYEAVNFEDQQKIDFTWNRTFNGHSAIPYNKVPVGFECSAMFKAGVLRFSQAQREAIAFMEIARSGIIAYDVGVGKTMSAIITLANNLYSGKCLRPLIVVPNPTYAKWVREVIGYTDEKTKQFVPGVLSNVGYKVNEWYNLGSAIAKKIDFSKKVAVKTITVLTYEGFAKIGFSTAVFATLFQELSYILNQQSTSKLSQRDIEKRNQTYKEMLGQGNKGTVADIDTLGIDYMVIDEAHNFKNVFDTVLSSEDGVKRFKITGNQSTRAIKAFFLCNYIQRAYGRNVMLLTATPFTNSPLEIYSMLSLVAYNYMMQNGLTNVQRFMESFVLQTLEYVNSYDDTIKEQHVVKSFNNRLVLQQLIFNHIAYKTGEDAGVKRPCKINLPRIHARDSEGNVKRLEKDKQVLTYLEMTPDQKANQEEIVALSRSSVVGDGNIMRAMAQSLDNAVSPFLYKHNLPPADYKEFVEESPKIKYVVDCIRSVKAYHESRNEPVSGQVMYINRGKAFFGYIKEYLEKEVGYKQKVKFNKDTLDEVEIITSGMTLEKKEMIKDAFLEGICKVIIGTSTIREGIDLQKKSATLYNCYPDWNPTDVKQLEGRIWRQGNEFGYIRVVMPLVQDSMDVFVFQKLEEKTSRINDLWYRGGSANVIDLESIDPEEVKFALFTNMDAIVKIVIDKERKEVQRNLAIIESNIDTLLRFDFKLRMYFKWRQESVELLERLKKEFALTYLSLSHYKDEQWWKKKTKENQDAFLERVRNVVDRTGQFLTGANQEDKEVLRIGRIYTHLKDEIDNRVYSNSTLSSFKEYLSEVKKAEDTILKQKGFTIHDNIPDIITAYKTDKEKVNHELEYLNSAEFFEEKYIEVKEKKDKMAVRGESPETRAKDFAKLNYLLSYKSADVDSESCLLPEMELTPSSANNDRDRRLRLVKLKAKAFLLKLSMK